MNDAFYDFAWPVSERYEWQDWLDPKGRVVVVPTDDLMGLDSPDAVELTWKHAQDSKEEYGPVLHEVRNESNAVRNYYPMRRECAALFREFGDLDYTNKESILKFAHKYGYLGVTKQHQAVRLRKARRGKIDHFAYGESYLRWAVEICFMKEGLQTQSRKRRSLEDFKRLKWLFDRNLQQVRYQLAFDKAGEPEIVLEPFTLISAMWLQLALAITGDKRFVACKFCRRLFEISTELSGFRTHREFCSDSCKTKDYRKRRRTALRLAADGKGVREISEKVSTETTTVRSWLAAAKKSGAATSKGDL